jgi:hypothetical protein
MFFPRSLLLRLSLLRLSLLRLSLLLTPNPVPVTARNIKGRPQMVLCNLHRPPFQRIVGNVFQVRF